MERNYHLAVEESAADLCDALSRIASLPRLPGQFLKFLGGVAVNHWTDESGRDRVSFSQAYFTGQAAPRDDTHFGDPS